MTNLKQPQSFTPTFEYTSLNRETVMKTKKPLYFAVAFLAVAVTCSTTSAGIIVKTPGTSIQTGGAGFVDVLISTTDGDNLAGAFYEFDLTTVSGGSALEITAIEGGAIGNVLTGYVFEGTDHLGQELDPGSSLPGTNFLASDALDLDPGVTVTDALLTRIHFQHTPGPGGPDGAIGDQFAIALVNGADTLFEDDLFTELTIASGSFDAGFITITAVPEPSSALLLVAPGLLLAARRRRRASA